MEELTPLDYQQPDAATVRQPTSPAIPLAVCCLFTPIALILCVGIGVLNARAGYVLPRTSFGRWQVSQVQNEATWRREWGFRLNDPLLPARRLTPGEDATTRAEVGANVANGRLRNWAETGKIQYVLIPWLLVVSSQLLWRRRSRFYAAVGSASLLTALVCGAMMAYWTLF